MVKRRLPANNGNGLIQAELCSVNKVLTSVVAVKVLGLNRTRFLTSTQCFTFAKQLQLLQLSSQFIALGNSIKNSNISVYNVSRLVFKVKM